MRFSPSALFATVAHVCGVFSGCRAIGLYLTSMNLPFELHGEVDLDA